MKINVIMFGDGCISICMSVWGHTGTNVQANNTKKDRNRLPRYDSRTCMARKFPKKDMYVNTGIKDKGGLRRLGMDSDWCSGMH